MSSIIGGMHDSVAGILRSQGRNREADQFLVEARKTERIMSKWNWTHWMGCLSGTALFVCTVMLIGCGANGCFDSDQGIDKNYCDSACSTIPLATIEAISGIIAIAMCILCCSNKN